MTVLLAAVVAAPAAQADFRSALAQYQAGQHEQARREFLRLANVGDAASQYNLGAMALHGQGGPVDRGVAVGWLLAARENGSNEMDTERLDALQTELTPAEVERSARVVASYGRDAMLDHVLPQPPDEASCPGFAPPEVRMHAQPIYSHLANLAAERGAAVISYKVGTDGLAYDVNTLLSAPTAAFSQAAIDAVLASRFVPATSAGTQVTAAGWHFVGYKLSGGFSNIWERDIVAGLRASAAAGALDALYLYGAIATLDPGVGESPESAAAAILDAAQGGDVDAQYWLAVMLAESRRCGADRALPWLRAAAGGGHPAASVTLAERLLEGEPDAARVAAAKRWLLSAVGTNNAYAAKHAIAHLAASPRRELRDADAALRASKTLFLKNYSRDPQAHEAYAAARAASGDFKDAVAAQHRGLEAAEKLYWNTALMRERLAAYEDRRMWYGDLLAVPPTRRTLPDP